jgi:SAM-dependent methyltransferase
MQKYDYWGFTQQEQYDEQLEIVYSTSHKDGFENKYNKEDATRGVGVYGEATQKGVENILAARREFFNDPDGVFYDLGCGTGKLVSHIALGSRLSKVCGIEKDPIRYRKAKKLVNKIEFPFTKPTIVHGDFYELDLSDATIIYCDNTMYEFNKHSVWTKKLFSSIRVGTVLIFKQPTRAYGSDTGHIRIHTSYGSNTGHYVVYEGLFT